MRKRQQSNGANSALYFNGKFTPGGSPAYPKRDVTLITLDASDRIAIKFLGSKFSRIADFELFAEKFLRTAGLREKSATATKFPLNKFREWLKIREIRED